MLKSIRTKSLFGRFDYYLDFSLNKMTILTGPNGFGKTTILRILRDILDDDLLDLVSIPFDEIELRADKDFSLLFEKKNDELFLNNEKIFVPIINHESGTKNIYFTLNNKDLNILRQKQGRYIMSQQFLSVDTVYSSDPTITATTNDYLARANVQIYGKQTLKFIDDLLNFYSCVGNTIFCGADRLFRDYQINDGGRNKKILSDVIGSLSEKLNLVFNYYNQEYTALSNKLDYSYLNSLIKEIDLSNNENLYTESQYSEDASFIKEKLNKLTGYGFLIDKYNYAEKIIFRKEYRLAFKVFNENYKEKIGVLEGLIDKLDLFTKIINSKLVNKNIVVHKDRFGNNIEARDGDKIIPLQCLSSGEQEIIVLYFKLIFEFDDQLIALVDEPELSSHVSWQYDMIKDFESILKVNKNVNQIIICTHSPQVINDKYDQTIDLFELSEQKNE